MKTWMAAALVGLALSTGARADVLDFETVTPTGASFFPLLGNRDEVASGAYWFGVALNDPDVGPGEALVGALVDGRLGAGACLQTACPDGNASNYLAVLGDAVLVMGVAEPGRNLRLSGFDANVIGDEMVLYGKNPVLLNVVGVRASDGVLQQTSVMLPGYSWDTESFSFQHFVLDSGFAQTDFSALMFFGAACDADGLNCTPFTTGRGQFALDNLGVTLSAVPEPAAWGLMSIGLLAVAWRRRRGA